MTVTLFKKIFIQNIQTIKQIDKLWSKATNLKLQLQYLIKIMIKNKRKINLYKLKVKKMKQIQLITMMIINN